MCGRIVTVSFEEAGDLARALELELAFDTRSSQPERSKDAFPNEGATVLVALAADAQQAHDEELDWNRETLDAIDAVGDRHVAAVRKKWGFETQNRTQVVFNTRIETASERPLWRESLEHRRCIVPVRAFYERHGSEKGIDPRTGRAVKQLYRFTTPDGILLIAGIWQGDRFSIVTTEPNEYVAAVHDRMPLVLSSEDARTWLLGDWRSVPRISDVELAKAPLYTPQQTAHQPRLF